MKKTIPICLVFCFMAIKSFCQDPSKVDYDAFEKLVKEVKSHRQNRLITLERFLKMSKMDDVIILDTRSKEMYDAKHLKGARHLNFSDFTQENLAEILPSKKTRVLIYCNNNFDNDQVYFATKVSGPLVNELSTPSENKNLGITMALNIPTYINLYGYGYKNVYELSELVSVNDKRIKFIGTSVKP